MATTRPVTAGSISNSPSIASTAPLMTELSKPKRKPPTAAATARPMALFLYGCGGTAEPPVAPCGDAAWDMICTSVGPRAAPGEITPTLAPTGWVRTSGAWPVGRGPRGRQDRPMDGTGGAKRPRRPAMLDPAQAEELPGGYDPALRNEVAHTTAAALVHQGAGATPTPRSSPGWCPSSSARGSTSSPPCGRTARRTACPARCGGCTCCASGCGGTPRPSPTGTASASRRRPCTTPSPAWPSAPGPADVLAVADAVLSGVFTGDLAVALERAAAFCRVLATGAAFDADYLEDVDPSARPAADPRRRVPRAHGRGARARRLAVAGRTGWSDVAHVPLA